jgi:stage II sporulation protein D
MEVDGESRTVAMNSQEFRRVFGFDRVRSTDFSLRWLGRQLQIHGTGIGHGVGMCQTGARELAEEGMSYRDILKLYYPKANLWTINQI